MELEEEYADFIRGQWAKLGLGLDYSRERFTLDEGLSKAVREVFVKLYEKGLIYRGEYIINWDPATKTALSDIEVIYKDVQGAFYHMRYPLKDGSGSIEIATTRPETMLGDTAVAVHPEDERYKHLIGKTVILPITGREIPIVGDDYVDMEFGSGAVKITPAHDPNDFEIGNRHNLERILVMNEDGTMNDNALQYKGMDRFECRKQIVKDLQEEGVLFKIEEHTHSVGHSERSGAVVEPYLSTQWFVQMHACRRRHRIAKSEGKVNFVPDRFEKRICTGWKISATGAFPASSGGAIGFRHGTIKKPVKSMSALKRRKMQKTGSRTKTFLIHGSVPLFGRFQRWAGLISMRKISSATIRRTSLSQATILFSSGYRE